MAQELSERARRFLQTWKREPYVDDLKLVRAALDEAGVPVTDPVLDFHKTFGGYITDVWGEVGPLGIIHRKVGFQSWYEPMKVGGYLNAKEKSWHLACADIHMSYEMMIDIDGTFYCNGPESSSYFMWTEQCAFVWEFNESHRAQRMQPIEPEAKPGMWHRSLGAKLLQTLFLPRLASHRISLLSDQYGAVYATDEWLVTVGCGEQRYNVWTVEGKVPHEFQDPGLCWRPFGPPPFAERVGRPTKN